MSTTDTSIASMSVFERYLTVWVALCIMAGIALGQMSAAQQNDLAKMAVSQGYNLQTMTAQQITSVEGCMA